MRVQNINPHVAAGMEGIARFQVLQMEMMRQIPKLPPKDIHRDFINYDKLGRNLPGDLISQAQQLLKKSSVFEKISQGLQRCGIYQPCVQNLPVAATLQEEDSQVTSLHRDRAVTNIRFFNIFYGYSPGTFALAVNILDRLLGKVKANPKYLSCIATTCFYVAVKTNEPSKLMDRNELLKLSQCGGHESDLDRMENLIMEKLQWYLESVNPYGFIVAFLEAILVEINAGWDCLNLEFVSDLMAKLEIILCQFKFTKFRMETLALALFTYELNQYNGLALTVINEALMQLQLLCQISEDELAQCRGMLADHVRSYLNQSSKAPRLQLSWTVSRRTLSKMKPSTKVLSDLEPIMEDEFLDDAEDSPDISCFDSENDDLDSPICNRAFITPSLESNRAITKESKANEEITSYLRNLEVLNRSITLCSIGDKPALHGKCAPTNAHAGAAY